MVTSVDIGGTPVSEFKVVSGTEIWATVAGDANGTIHVANADATASSPTDFTNANPGGCSPTITYLAPCGGTAGVIVIIIGTNLLKSSGMTTTAAVGGDVRFAPYTATATHTGTPETPTRHEVLVPPGTIDGPIRVSTFNDVVGEGAVLSNTRFEVVPPECDLFPLEQPRSVTLRLRKHLVARGMVSLTTEGEDSTVCMASVPVKIQRRVSGHWKTVGSTTTNDIGAYNKRIKDKPGRYRARAPMIFLVEPVFQTCVRALSPVRTRS
jgi:hypothetical protein